jgi:tail protein P2 I
VGVYGIDLYGQGRFGRDPSLVRPDFSVDPFQAIPLDYSTLHLTWQKPQSSACTFLRLVRNPRNLPQDEDDGLYLWGSATTTPTYAEPVQRPANLTDLDLDSGFLYYTMWGWDSVNSIWVRCSDLIALVPINWGYGYRLYNLMPMAYRDRDIVLVDPYNPWPVDNPRPPLQRYLSLLGFQIDFIRTELESLMSVNDAQNCSGALLPLMAQQLGLQNEPEIGMQQERQLTSNAIHLYKLKGSPRGISEFTSLLTSYPMSVLSHHGYNLLLCRDDSIAETSIGTWQAWPPPVTRFPGVVGNTGLTLTQNPNMLTGPTAVAGMTNPLETYPGFNPGPNPPYNYSGIQARVTGGGDIYITTARVPVTDFMSSSYGPGTVTWRIQIWSSVSRQVSLSLWGDNGSGTAVQILAPQTFTETAGHWTVMTVTGPINPYPNGLGQPAAFYWVLPRIRIIGTAANESHYLTLMGLWPCTPSDLGVNTPIYDYPRDVKITLSPQSSNLLSNPLTSFANGFDGLTAAIDPLQASINMSCSLQIHYVSAEDPALLFAVNGTGSLQVITTGPNGTVWFGSVGSFSVPQPPYPQGWFSDPNHDWFGGSAPSQPLSRPWMDPIYSWHFENNQYFSLGAPIISGNWFPTPAQPPLNGNLVPFNVPPYQPFNFSVYSRYVQVLDPSNAVMLMGFRWYYPDGTWTETTTQYTVGSSFQRYSIAPSDPNQAWMGIPPTEPLTNAQPTTMFPFVRFPYGQQANFLLNSAMLSPGTQTPPYFDFSLYSGNSDYIPDSHGASYYFRHFKPRHLRLAAELYRWIPMGASHTEIFAAEAVLPPLDPTLWTHPALVLRGTTTMAVTPS